MEVRGVRIRLGYRVSRASGASPSWRWSLKPREGQKLWWVECREPFQTCRGWEARIGDAEEKHLRHGENGLPFYVILILHLQLFPHWTFPHSRTTTVHGVSFPPESDHHLAASWPPTPGFPGQSYISKPFCVFSYVSNFEHSISCNSFPSTWKTHLSPRRLYHWNHSQL